MNHKIIFAEHIVCVFPENIISRFDVSVNDVAKEFAERLQSNFEGCHKMALYGTEWHLYLRC